MIERGDRAIFFCRPIAGSLLLLAYFIVESYIWNEVLCACAYNSGLGCKGEKETRFDFKILSFNYDTQKEMDNGLPLFHS